jgi:3-oxoacyl-[acyl-carrier protein] reductase
MSETSCTRACRTRSSWTAVDAFGQAAKREDAEGRGVFRKVVNVASMAASGAAGLAAYSTAKTGVIGLTRTLAEEWGALKVNVNAVAFGVIEPDMTAGFDASVTAAVRATTPLGRPGTASEAAGVIAFPARPGATTSRARSSLSPGMPAGMTV